jgi:hypothetical protein
MIPYQASKWLRNAFMSVHTGLQKHDQKSSYCSQNRTKTRESMKFITERARVQDGSEIESVEALCERLSCGRKVKTINLHGHTIQQPASAPPQDLSSAWRKVALWPVQVRCISSFSLFFLFLGSFYTALHVGISQRACRDVWGRSVFVDKSLLCCFIPRRSAYWILL